MLCLLTISLSLALSNKYGTCVMRECAGQVCSPFTLSGHMLVMLLSASGGTLRYLVLKCARPWSCSHRQSTDPNFCHARYPSHCFVVTSYNIQANNRTTAEQAEICPDSKISQIRQIRVKIRVELIQCLSGFRHSTSNLLLCQWLIWIF